MRIGLSVIGLLFVSSLAGCLDDDGSAPAPGGGGGSSDDEVEPEPVDTDDLKQDLGLTAGQPDDPSCKRGGADSCLPD